jgi:hypothetical protein
MRCECHAWISKNLQGSCWGTGYHNILVDNARKPQETSAKLSTDLAYIRNRCLLNTLEQYASKVLVLKTDHCLRKWRYLRCHPAWTNRFSCKYSYCREEDLQMRPRKAGGGGGFEGCNRAWHTRSWYKACAPFARNWNIMFFIVHKFRISWRWWSLVPPKRLHLSTKLDGSIS